MAASSIRGSVAPYAGAWVEIYNKVNTYYYAEVAPYAGAWVEMHKGYKHRQAVQVAPYAGAWIEMLEELEALMCGNMSLPTRERGLKSSEPFSPTISEDVAPYAGAWIEISTMSVPMLFGSVAPYAGAWIEITLRPALTTAASSLPTRGRGLKSQSVSH